MRFVHILAEIVGLWLIMTFMGGLLIWGARGFDSLGQLMMLGYTVVALGYAVKFRVFG